MSAPRRLKRLSSSQIDELVAAYQAGATQAALAERFGQHENTIGLHLRKRGVLGRGPRVLTDEQADELRRLRESEGLSYAALGRRFGVSEWTSSGITCWSVAGASVKRGEKKRAKNDNRWAILLGAKKPRSHGLKGGSPFDDVSDAENHEPFTSRYRW